MMLGVNMGEYINNTITAIITALIGVVLAFIRIVLTNQKEIALLKSEISDRDKRREEDRQFWRELKDDVKEVKRDILDLYKKQQDH